MAYSKISGNLYILCF